MEEMIERVAALRRRLELADIFEQIVPDASCCGVVNDLADAEGW